MGSLTRRVLLAAPVAVAALEWTARPAAAAAPDRYPSNTALYADPALAEGVDYGRRYRRHAVTDDSAAGTVPFPRAVVLAPHGGGIEGGTSELCLAVAGYHPDTLAPEPAAGPVHDYWMFEGLRRRDNGELHVTSAHCDDPEAGLLTAGSRAAVSLHGCSTGAAGLPDGTAAVLVGGLAAELRERLLAAYAAAGIRALDATAHPDLGGVDPRNIVNRTFAGRGAQLEITAPLRAAMFEVDTVAGRRTSTTPAFWRFAGATRTALT
jgi:phage replication-related protein YjqB (UPF0714/DUF867 family)